MSARGDMVRERMGQAISDYLCGLSENGQVTLDPFDARSIDAIVDAALAATPAGGGDGLASIISDIRHSALVDDYEIPQIAFLESIADRLASAPARVGWQPIESAPFDTPILLWNNDTSEIVVGHRPPDAPNVECVVVDHTAAYADAWHPLPDEPESEDDDGEATAPAQERQA